MLYRSEQARAKGGGGKEGRARDRRVNQVEGPIQSLTSAEAQQRFIFCISTVLP